MHEREGPQCRPPRTRTSDHPAVVRRVPPCVGARRQRPSSFYERFLAAAFPPLRPAALCWAVVAPCLALPPLPGFLPPRLDAPGEFAILAARSFDMPFSLRASYCFLFLTFAWRAGISSPSTSTAVVRYLRIVSPERRDAKRAHVVRYLRIISPERRGAKRG